MPTESKKLSKFERKKNITTKTVYNPGNALFNKLTRFFSGPIVAFKAPDVSNTNRVSMKKHSFSDIFGIPFKRDEDYYLLNQAQSEQNIEALRLQRYLDYDQMVLSPPEIKVALKVYANEIASYTEFSPILKIESPKDEIKAILKDLFYNTLNIEHNLFGWVQSMIKYGDFFLWLDIDEKLGIVGTKALPVYEIQRLEGEDPSNPNYIQFQWNAEGLTFENVEVCHFRILGDDKYIPYGQSILDPASKIVKQLNLMIEHMITYRIVRAPERLVFYHDVTGLEAKDIETFLEKNMSKLKRQALIDPDTGKMDYRYDVSSVEQNFHITTRKGSESKIEPLPGGQFVGDIEDIEILRDQLFTALMIPAPYLTNKDNDGEQSTLSQKNMTFAKEILRIQNSVIAELRKIAMIHLFVCGYSGKDLLSFNLKLNNPSKLAEMQEFEHLKLKSEVAASLSDHNISNRWIQSKIFNFSPEEIESNMYEILGDAQFQQILANIENSMSGATSEGGFAGLGDMGMSGGEIPGLDQQLGSEAPAPNPEDEFAEVGGEGSPLLVKPGEQHRRSNMNLTPKSLKPRETPGSNGNKYTPKSVDSRSQLRNLMNNLSGRNSIRPSYQKFLKTESSLNEDNLDEDEIIILKAEEKLKESIDLLKENAETKKNLINTRFANYVKRKKANNKLIRRPKDNES